jgi:hypothetical protein
MACSDLAFGLKSAIYRGKKLKHYILTFDVIFFCDWTLLCQTKLFPFHFNN